MTQGIYPSSPPTKKLWATKKLNRSDRLALGLAKTAGWHPRELRELILGHPGCLTKDRRNQQ